MEEERDRDAGVVEVEEGADERLSVGGSNADDDPLGKKGIADVKVEVEAAEAAAGAAVAFMGGE